MPQRCVRSRIRDWVGAGAVTLAATVFFSRLVSAQEMPPPPEELVIIATGGAFATGIYNSAIYDNVVIAVGTESTTVLENSVRSNLGIVQINQDSGAVSNQSNMVLIAVGAGARDAVADATLHVHASQGDNAVALADVKRSNWISNILDGSAGIVQINQNAGTLNTNVNALAIAVGLARNGAAVSLSDATLSAAGTASRVRLDGTIQQSNEISGLANFSGIAQITQTAGEGNVAVNSMTIGVTVVNR